jgi:hypothetical protein
MDKFTLNDDGDLIAACNDRGVELQRVDGTLLCRLSLDELSRLVNVWEGMQDINMHAEEFRVTE